MMTQGKPVPTLASPKKEGFYWAKWRIADDGTPEGDEQTPSDTWEVVHVFENCNDTDNPDWLRVEVPGQTKSQSLENFFWGPGPLDLGRAYYTPATELDFRYEVRAALGWNDKTSLDILANGVRDLRKSHDALIAALASLIEITEHIADVFSDHIKQSRSIIARAPRSMLPTEER